MFKLTFGEKLKAIRKEKGYSQEEMAGLLDVSRQAVSKWESDISSVTDAEMDALERKMEDLDVICAIIFYKTPVTACHDGNLEKLMEWTVYEDSNIIKEQIAQKTIRGRYISEEFLTFYVTVSDEDKNFILCHFHRQAAQPDNGNDLVYSGTDFYGINSGCFLTGVVNDRKVLICIRKKFMLEKMMTH